MQLLKLSDSVNFMRLRFPAMVLSTLLILGSFVSLGVNSLNWGLDFTGGTLIEVGYEDAANLSDIRGKLNDANFGDAIVQNFGSSQDVLIRISPRDGVKAATIGEQVLEALRADGTAVDMRRIEFVGPNVGEELTELWWSCDVSGAAMYLSLRGNAIRMAFCVGVRICTNSRCYSYFRLVLCIANRVRFNCVGGGTSGDRLFT